MRQSAALRKWNRPHNYVPWVVLVVTLLAAVIAWLIAHDIAIQRDRTRFEITCKGIQSTVLERLNHQLRLGNSAAAYMGSVDNAGRKDFDEFLARQGWPENAPEVGAISYLKHVPPGGGAAFAQYAVQHGVPLLDMDSGRDGLDRVLSLYRQPVEPGMTPPGHDATIKPDRRLALEESRDTGMPVATDLTYLAPDQLHRQPATIIFIPIYSTDETPTDVETRQKTISGYIGVAIRLSVVLDHLMDSDANPYISIRCRSNSVSDENVDFTNIPPGYRGQFGLPGHENLFNRNWDFKFVSSKKFETDRGEDLSPFILGGGVVFALILFFLSNAQLKTQKELAGYAEEIERLASAEGLLVLAGTLLAGTEDYKIVLGHIGRSAVPSLADLCSVDVLDNGEIKEVAVYVSDTVDMEEAVRISQAVPVTLEDKFGIGKALRTGKSELIMGLEREMASELGYAPEIVEFVEKRGFTSAMFVPIKVRDEVLANLTFITGPEKRSFTPSDLRQMEEVVERIGLAIDNSRLFLAAQQELGEKVKAEEALRTLNEELEQVVSERTRDLTVAVDELEAFCYSVSHDLRAPLRSVDGFSKALLEDYNGQLDADGVDYLNRIRRAAHRMDELITALLTLSRLTRAEINPSNVDVTEIAREIVGDNPDAKRGEVWVQDGMVAFADPHMVRIVLENLISNAIKFSGKVVSPEVRIGVRDGAFFVKDNGAGFDPRYSSKLFQPFERLHTPAEFPGSGIGLATVSRIVKRHGGKIWAESEVGKGAAFYFTFEPQDD